MEAGAGGVKDFASFGLPVVISDQMPPFGVRYVSAASVEYPNGAIVVGRAVDLEALAFDLSLDADDRAFLEAIKVKP